MMVDTMEEVVRPKRVKRRHSEEFKQAVVAACSEPNASLAGIAQANGVNANLVRKWIDKRGVARPSRRTASVALAPRPDVPQASFIAVAVASEPSGASPSTIQIEIRRGDTALTLTWPTEAASACASWLGEWLR